MKKINATVLLILFGLSLSALHAEPGTNSPGVNHRERHQRRRIRQGVKSGELTKDEAKSLRENERTTHSKEREMKSDGTLSKEERQELHQDLNDNSKEIKNEKHDAETR